MPRTPHRITLIRASIEGGCILFLFYANLLMGEFNRHADPNKTWAYAFLDIFSVKNLFIGIVGSLVGFLGFEALRRSLETK